MYLENHWVQVHIDEDVNIAYAFTWSRFDSRHSTHFDIEVKGDICYVNGFFIAGNNRGQGDGRRLYDIIERFCVDELDVKKFVTSPSGMGAEKGEDGKCFWEKMGFEYVGNSHRAEKLV